MWKRQYQFDDVTGESYLPDNNFSNFALHLAVMYKGETQTLIQNTFNRIFDLIQGVQEETLFEQPDNTPRTLAEAIEEVLNIKYNGQEGSNILAGNSTTSQDRQGSSRDSQARERAEGRNGTTIHPGGTKSNSGERIATLNDQIEEAAAEVNPDPTEGQKEDFKEYKEFAKEAQREGSEPKPIGTGAFGAIYDQFKGKPKEAVAFLMEKKEGEALGVFNRDGLGAIDLPYGSHKDKYGLEHIIEKHVKEQDDFSSVEEAISIIEDVITNGDVSRENNDKIVIDKDDYRVVVQRNIRDERGNITGSKNWVVTGFDTARNVKEKTPPRKTLTTPLSNQMADGVTLPSSGVSTSKDKQEVSNFQEKGDKQEVLGKLGDDHALFQQGNNITPNRGKTLSKREFGSFVEARNKAMGVVGRVVTDARVFAKLMGQDPRSVFFHEQWRAINERFNAELQQLIDGTLPHGHIFQLGNPTRILQSTGIPNLPIELSADRLKNKSQQQNHPFELADVTNLPSAIQNPIAVFESTKKDGTKVLLTELTDSKGNNYVVAVRVQKSANARNLQVEVNSVRSLYPKDHAQGILDWINSKDNLLVYADKEKALNFIQSQSTNLIAARAETKGLENTDSKQQYNSAKVENSINAATNIIQNFENPKIDETNLQADLGLSHEEVAAFEKAQNTKEEKRKPQQPWEQTKNQFAIDKSVKIDSEVKIIDSKPVYTYTTTINGENYSLESNRMLGGSQITDRMHEKIVKQAIAEGKEVPENIKKEVLEKLGDDHTLFQQGNNITPNRGKTLSKREFGRFVEAWNKAMGVVGRVVTDARVFTKLMGQDPKSVFFHEQWRAINERFNAELDAFKAGTHQGLLHLGIPLAILKASGVNAKEITLSQRVLSRHLKKHGLQEDDLKDLAIAIQKPMFTYEHGTKTRSIAIVTEMEVGGKKIAVALKMDKNGNVEEINNVASIHGKDALHELNKLSNQDNVDFKWIENKQDVLNWLGIGPINRASHTANSKHLALANIIQSFENPRVDEANLQADYRMHHTAPVGSDGFSVSIDRLNELYPDDVYSNMGWYYYGDGDRAMDKKTHSILKFFRGKPDNEITVYRAVPKGVTKINSGDWVSINREYAVKHGESNIDKVDRRKNKIEKLLKQQ